MDFTKKHKISVMISEEDIQKRIAEMGAEITKRFEGETVYLVCILKGSVFFTTELAKKIDKAVAKYEKLTGTKVNTFNFGNGSSDGASQNQVADLLKESAQYSEYEEEKNKDIESVKTK